MATRKILFLAANPINEDRLRLDAEIRDIEEGIQRASLRDEISFSSRVAVRARDMSRSLLDTKPQIVHFSGHGAGDNGIVIEDENGASFLIGTHALANLFALHKDTVQCVVLNACFSNVQAQAISEHIPYVIGMSSSVNDESALAFAVGFYDAIGAGLSYEEAFKHGKNAIELGGLPDQDLPTLLKGSNGTQPVSLNQAEMSETGIDAVRFEALLDDLRAIAADATRVVHCIGTYKAVPFDQIYQPTKLLFRSGLDISASAAFGEQNRIAKSIAVSHGEQFHSQTVENFLESPEDTVIFAGPGWGKTTFLHHLFRRMSTHTKNDTVLLTLRRDGSVIDLESLSKYWFSQRSHRARKVLLLVDGYDEIPVADRKRVSEALQLFSASRKGRFVLTCRDFYHVIDLNVSNVRIDGFDKDDQFRFVTAFLAAQGSAVNAVKLVNDLEARSFSEFLSHPLLLALACIVNIGYRTEQPRSQLRLLKKALTTLQQSWDSERGIARESLIPTVDGEDRLQILKRIAFASRSPFMRAERVEAITRLALDKMQINKVSPELVLQEIAQFYGILVPSGEGWEFVHRTIQDYLAAQYWVDSGGFASREKYEWDTRTAYAACISGDATKVLEGALAAEDGLTCASETLTNYPDFDNKRVGIAITKFYSLKNRVTIFERNKDRISAEVEDDLFMYFSVYFLNYLIEQLAKNRSPVNDALVGCCLSELRARKERTDFTTYEILRTNYNNLRLQFRIASREVVSPEMARPV